MMTGGGGFSLTSLVRLVDVWVALHSNRASEAQITSEARRSLTTTPTSVAAACSVHNRTVLKRTGLVTEYTEMEYSKL